MKLPQYRAGGVQGLGREDVSKAGAIGASLTKGIADIAEVFDEMDEEQARLDVMRAEAEYVTEKAKREQEREATFDYDPKELKDRYGITEQPDAATGRVPGWKVDERLEKYDAEELSKKYGSKFTGKRRKQLWEKVITPKKVESYRRTLDRVLVRRQQHFVAQSSEATNQIIENVTPATRQAAEQMARTHRQTQINNGVSADKARADYETNTRRINRNLRGNELEDIEDRFDEGDIDGTQARKEIKEAEKKINDPKTKLTNDQRLELRDRADALRKQIENEEKKDRQVRAQATAHHKALQLRHQFPGDLEKQLAEARKWKIGNNTPQAQEERDALMADILNMHNQDKVAKDARVQAQTSRAWKLIKNYNRQRAEFARDAAQHEFESDIPLVQRELPPPPPIDTIVGPDVPAETRKKMAEELQRGGPPRVSEQGVNDEFRRNEFDPEFWRTVNMDDYQGRLSDSDFSKWSKVKDQMSKIPPPTLKSVRNYLDRVYEDAGLDTGKDADLATFDADELVRQALAEKQEEKLRQGKSPELTASEAQAVAAETLQVWAKGRSMAAKGTEVDIDDLVEIYEEYGEPGDYTAAIKAIRDDNELPTITNMLDHLKAVRKERQRRGMKLKGSTLIPWE